MSPIRPYRLIVKALLLFILLNLVFTLVSSSSLGKLSGYNRIFPGRERLPFGESPREAYNFSLYNLDAMFKSLALDRKEKSGDEYRVLIVGDSSVWGILLKPEETLSGQLTSANLTVCGKQVIAYNLGYPTISLTKDLLILDRAKRYKPDLIIWLTTLESFPINKQLTTPLISNNAAEMRILINKFGFNIDPSDPNLINESFFDKTILGKRREIMDLVRLQLYGVMWGATGVDQVYPTDYPPAAVDLEPDDTFHGLNRPMDDSALALDILEAGFSAAGEVPILLINEPMLISQGRNSEIRYNFFYPRWAYDRYRESLVEETGKKGWEYLDLWDLVPPAEFTNSAIHLTPVGEKMLAEKIGKAIVKSCRLK
jgi:hypothetical protein